MTGIQRTLWFLLLSAAFGSIHAQTGDDAYAAGLAAARAGAFEDAAALFADAQRSGMNKPALTYNMGVVSFKQGHLDDAAAAFQALTDDPHWGPLAHYNLGLTEERRGNLGLAQKHFRQARDLADLPNLKALAEHKLQERRPATGLGGRRGSAGMALHPSVPASTTTCCLLMTSPSTLSATRPISLERFWRPLADRSGLQTAACSSTSAPNTAFTLTSTTSISVLYRPACCGADRWATGFSLPA